MKKIINKVKENRDIADRHFDKKLRRRLRIFYAMIAVFIIITIYKLLIHDITLLLTITALTIGTIAGFIFGRMFKISWHNETEKVISRLDKIGLIFLVLYITADLGRKWFFGHWLQGAQLNAFALIFVGGLIFGRLISIRKNIKRVLTEENKI